MRCLGVIGRVREKIRIFLRNARCPFSVRLEQCSSIVVVSHGVEIRTIAQTTLIYRVRGDYGPMRPSEGSGSENERHVKCPSSYFRYLSAAGFY